ncbi:helix-turn-helix domain-containing protein [Mycobacterium sp. NPDC048908]|uniref:helix-turn-helix domain-containing protein n=1 Tax=Mycobacterium sp. NPDC048908 TaxID=3364292 RepID=UPI003713D1D9
MPPRKRAAHAGRPRDTSIDDRVLAATRELLVELGWDGLSIRLVAARAGVSRSSLNRRWQSKAELVLHAILGASPDLSPFEGTDRHGWISWVVRGSSELFSRPDMKAAVPGLMRALKENGQLRRQMWADFTGPAVRLFAVDSEATETEAADAELEARALLAMAAGAALFLTTVADDDDSAEILHRVESMLTSVAGTQR